MIVLDCRCAPRDQQASHLRLLLLIREHLLSLLWTTAASATCLEVLITADIRLLHFMMMIILIHVDIFIIGQFLIVCMLVVINALIVALRPGHGTT